MAEDTQQPASATPSPQDAPVTPISDPINKVIDKIHANESILVALSRDPNVDELAAAIALTMLLDKTGKHATAIFSGQIPKSMHFLQPGKTLEPNTNSLQDFIISLNKEKADHLRYKVEGDFVKIYITPYRTELSEKDLEFTRGDYNVNLVISIDVKSSDDLDAALAEHGRIMHDATSINVSLDTPGKFADLEWSNPNASSISEMVNTLAARLQEGDEPLVDPTIATTLLTGIMSATDRFGNERTTPGTLTLASELMSVGADQRLISENIATPEEPAEETQTPEPVAAPTEKEKPAQPNKLEITHDEEPEEPSEASADSNSATPEDPTPEPTPDITPPSVPEPEPQVPGEKELEKVIQPLSTPVGTSLMEELRATTEPTSSNTDKDYASMIEKELADSTPTEESTPEASAGQNSATSEESTEPSTTPPEGQDSTPVLPMPDSDPLPPPPAPFDPTVDEPVAPPPAEVTPPAEPVDPIAPAAPPVPELPTPLGDQPAMQDQVYDPPVNNPATATDPASFQLPVQ